MCLLMSLILYQTLYKNTDFGKITSVISSELTVYYGLYTTEFDSEKLTEEIFEWWKNK